MLLQNSVSFAYLQFDQKTTNTPLGSRFRVRVGGHAGAILQWVRVRVGVRVCAPSGATTMGEGCVLHVWWG